MATRNRDFASLYRKVITMRNRVEAKKEADAAKEAPMESSVGTIEAAADVDSGEEPLAEAG